MEFHGLGHAEPGFSDRHGHSGIRYAHGVTYRTHRAIGVGMGIRADTDRTGQHMPLFDHNLMGDSLSAQIVEIRDIVFAHRLAPLVEHSGKLWGGWGHEVVGYADHPVFVKDLVYPELV